MTFRHWRDLLLKEKNVHETRSTPVEQLPNVNDARRFANLRAHRGRVFLAGYADLRDDMMVWGDDLSKSDRRTAEEEDRSRYTVTLNQYKCMQTSLYRIRDCHCLFPNPDALEQEVIENGQSKRILLLRDWVFKHFTKTALVVEQDEQTSKPRAKVLKIGLDPHFSYANMLLDVGWARSFGTTQFILPNAGSLNKEGGVRSDAVLAAMPGLPAAVAAMMEQPTDTCGKCAAFHEGKCAARNFNVLAGDPACPIFEPMPVAD